MSVFHVKAIIRQFSTDCQKTCVIFSDPTYSAANLEFFRAVFLLSVEKRRPKLLLWPNPVNQLKLKANACCRLKAREHVFVQITIGFVLSSDWMTKWHVSFNEPITN